jgi:copper chaperone CopZ
MDALIAAAAARSPASGGRSCISEQPHKSQIKKNINMNNTPTTTEIITIAGMSCGHCVAAVRQALQEIDGVEVQEVAIGSAHIQRDPDQVSNQQIVDAIEDAGYTVSGINQEPAH